MDNLHRQGLHPKSLTRSPRHQAGVATLIATVVLLVVVTLSALMVARSAFFELKVSGSDIRDKEVYASAISGLDYGIQWLIDGDEVWDDLDPADGSGLAGAMTYAPNPAEDLVQRADIYTFDPNGDGTSEISFELMNNENEAAAIVKVNSVATALKNSEVNKGVEVLVIKASLLQPSIVDGPPLVVEDCAEGVTGTPKIFPGLITDNPQDPPNAEFRVRVSTGDPEEGPPGTLRQDDDGNYIPELKPAIASVNTDEDEDCVDEGLFTTHYVDSKLDGYAPTNKSADDDPKDKIGIPVRDELGNPIVDKVYAAAPEEPIDFYSSFFSIPPSALRELSHAKPESVIYVDAEYATSAPDAAHAYSYNGNVWNTSLGSDSVDADGNYNDQVVLFFPKELPCPDIKGASLGNPVKIYGLVFVERKDCDLQGWGNLEVYGTVAVSGSLTQFNANVQIHDRDLDTFHGADNPFSVVSIIPGSWKDF